MIQILVKGGNCINSVYDSNCLEPLPVSERFSVNKIISWLRIEKLRFVPVNIQLIRRYMLYSRVRCTKVGYSYYLKFLAVNDNLVDRKRVNRKAREEPQAEAAANPRHQEEEKKWHKINVCIANKWMHDKHKDQLPLYQARCFIKMLKGQKNT